MPNLQRGGACLNFAYFSMQFYNPGDPKGGHGTMPPPKKIRPWPWPRSLQVLKMPTSPQKLFGDLYFFWKTLAPCVLSSWPWPRALLSLASRGSVLEKSVLGLGFFCVLGLGLNGCVLDSASDNYLIYIFTYHAALQNRCCLPVGLRQACLTFSYLGARLAACLTGRRLCFHSDIDRMI